MWNTNSFDMSTNGGFVTDNDGQGGSTTKKKEAVRRIQSVVPIFISFITECTDEDFTLYGMPVQIADIVGVLTKFEVQSTKATCEIQDHSASIKAILWLETDDDSVTAIPPVKENCYVRVFGSIRTQDGEKIVMILKIVPVEDLNVITNHRLQVVHVKLYAERLANGEPVAGALTSGPSNALTMGSMSFSDLKPDTQENPHSLKPTQLKIISLLKACKAGMGMSRNEILARFEPGQAKDVRATLDFLLDEGHAYTTVDNDHFKATD